MGVDEAESLEAGGGGAEAVQIGDENVPVRAGDDAGDVALPVDQDPDLAVDFPGKICELPGQFMSDKPVRGKAASIKLLQPLDLFRLQAGDIAINPVDKVFCSIQKCGGTSPLIIYSVCGMPFCLPIALRIVPCCGNYMKPPAY